MSKRPIGFESKNEIGARITEANNLLCKLTDEFMQIVKKEVVFTSEKTNRVDTKIV